MLGDLSFEDFTTPFHPHFECVSLVLIKWIFEKPLPRDPIWGGDVIRTCHVLSLPGRSTLTGLDLISCPLIFMT